MTGPPPRVCLLTGAAGTLGTDFLQRHGARYDVVAVVGESPLQVPAHVDWPPPGAGVYAVQADLFDDGVPAEVAARVVDHFGGVDLLVNAAAHSVWADLLDGDELLDSLPWQLHLNVVVPAAFMVALGAGCWAGDPDANRRRNRNVVNLSSLAGHRVFGGLGQAGYAASKAALEMLTRHAALELAPRGVRVNALAPDAFPGRVPTGAVSDAVVVLDQGTATGEVVDLGPGTDHGTEGAPGR